MQSSAIPIKMPVIWGSSAPVANIQSPIPNASQIGIVNGQASFTDGWPPLTFLPGSSGGVPPFGKDFNGLHNQLTAWDQWFQAGMAISATYDASFATSGTFNVGGYPKGAIIQSSATPGKFWLNAAENNTSNPDTGGANWQPFLLGNSGVVAAVYTRPQITVNSAGQITVAASGAQPTRTILTSGAANYNPQANAPAGFTCTRLFVRFAGGGGAGSNGGAGNDSIFNGVHAKGGSTGGVHVSTSPGSGGAGGTGGTGTAYLRIPGGDGAPGQGSANGFPGSPGGNGGSTPFFSGAGAGGNAAAGSSGKTNTGGGGGGTGGGLSAAGDGGGGSSEYVELQITFPGSTLIAYTVAAAVGNGAAGIILIDEYYD